ncbi:MAG: hypothetical protein ACRDNF_07185 [Streptosporangiaceae bacterium]
MATAAAMMLFATAAGAMAAPAGHGAPGSAAHNARSAGTRHCYVVIKQVRPGSPDTRVVAQGCYGSHSPRPKVLIGCSPVVVVWQNEDYTGLSIPVCNESGPCSSLDVYLPNLTYENTTIRGISSYRTSGGCINQKYWDTTSGLGTTPCKTWNDYTAVRYVGAKCNDDLKSMYMWA